MELTPAEITAFQNIRLRRQVLDLEHQKGVLALELESRELDRAIRDRLGIPARMPIDLDLKTGEVRARESDAVTLSMPGVVLPPGEEN